MWSCDDDTMINLEIIQNLIGDSFCEFWLNLATKALVIKKL